jgi:hypothetical protein
LPFFSQESTAFPNLQYSDKKVAFLVFRAMTEAESGLGTSHVLSENEMIQSHNVSS